MTIFWNVNKNPDTGAYAMFQLVQTMISGGFTQAGSGDATTFSNSGSGPVIHGGTGTGGFGNNRAWVRMQVPIMTYGNSSSIREFCIQRGDADTNWWIRYSISGSFIGTGNGAISATVTPTATEQVNLWGSTAAGTQLFDANLTYRCHVMVDGANPYGFYLLALTNGGGGYAGNKSIFMMDPCTATSSLDPDPYAFYVDYDNKIFNTYSAGSGRWYVESPNVLCLFSPVTSSANYKTITAATYSIFSNGYYTGCNPFDGLMITLPILYARRSGATAPNGPKGFSTLVSNPTTIKTTGDIISSASLGANDRIMVNDFCLPWNGSVVKL